MCTYRVHKEAECVCVCSFTLMDSYNTYIVDMRRHISCVCNVCRNTHTHKIVCALTEYIRKLRECVCVCVFTPTTNLHRSAPSECFLMGTHTRVICVHTRYIRNLCVYVCELFLPTVYTLQLLSNGQPHINIQ